MEPTVNKIIDKHKEILNKVKIIGSNEEKAILDKCLDCTYNSPEEVFFCEIDGCPLWNIRKKLLEKIKEK